MGVVFFQVEGDAEPEVCVFPGHFSGFPESIEFVMAVNAELSG